MLPQFDKIKSRGWVAPGALDLIFPVNEVSVRILENRSFTGNEGVRS